MKKFLVGGFDMVYRIDEVDILRETDKTVVVLGWKGKEKSRRKDTAYNRYFDTWEQAKDYIINDATAKLATAKSRFEYAERRLSEVKKMVKE